METGYIRYLLLHNLASVGLCVITCPLEICLSSKGGLMCHVMRNEV